LPGGGGGSGGGGGGGSGGGGLGVHSSLVNTVHAPCGTRPPVNNVLLGLPHIRTGVPIRGVHFRLAHAHSAQPAMR
jgi:hypothetical protein